MFLFMSALMSQHSRIASATYMRYLPMINDFAIYTLQIAQILSHEIICSVQSIITNTHSCF